MIQDNLIYEIVQYGWLISPPIFLFGAIKLSKSHPSTGCRLLIIGFGLLTLHSVIKWAQYLALFEIHYNPSYDIDGSGTTWINVHEGLDLDKWAYWLVFAFQALGYIISACGFFSLSRKLSSNAQRSIHLPTLES